MYMLLKIKMSPQCFLHFLKIENEIEMLPASIDDMLPVLVAEDENETLHNTINWKLVQDEKETLPAFIFEDKNKLVSILIKKDNTRMLPVGC